MWLCDITITLPRIVLNLWCITLLMLTLWSVVEIQCVHLQKVAPNFLHNFVILHKKFNHLFSLRAQKVVIFVQFWCKYCLFNSMKFKSISNFQVGYWIMLQFHAFMDTNRLFVLNLCWRLIQTYVVYDAFVWQLVATLVGSLDWIFQLEYKETNL
jgi:hypothetical protein